jgi:phosphate starvation-inducible PhoH-like protein
LRGTTFHDKIVLLDEAQNAELDQLIIVLTRLGEHGKLVVIGDSNQVDIRDKKSYGNVVAKFNSEECKSVGIQSFTLTEDDIKRSKILKFIVGKLNELKSNR